MTWRKGRVVECGAKGICGGKGEGRGGGGGSGGGVGDEEVWVWLCGSVVAGICERRSWSRVGMRVNGEAMGSLTREKEKRR